MSAWNNGRVRCTCTKYITCLKMPLIQFSKPGFSLQEWIVEHGSEQVRKPLNAVIAALQADGVSRFGATGYCFGGTLMLQVCTQNISMAHWYRMVWPGRYVFDLAFENVIHVAVTAHPSLLKSPDDFEVNSLILVFTRNLPVRLRTFF